MSARDIIGVRSGMTL